MKPSFTLPLLSLLVASEAAAHGGPPGVLSVLGWDAQGVSSVRLSHGLALRTEDGFRYVCPEAWRGDAFAPAASIPDGPAVVAAAQLFLVDAEGRLTPHPEDVGEGIALARNSSGLFGLFRRDGQLELRRIEVSQTRLLHRLDEPFTLLAARDDTLSLMRVAQRTLVVQNLSLRGELTERVTWEAPVSVAFAELRVASEQLYTVVWGNSKPWVTLGRVTPQGHVLLREGQSSIAGPLALAQGLAVAVDGSLQPLDEDAAALTQGDGAVHCLDSFAGHDYACVSGGLKRAEEGGIGESIFQLAALREPDYQLLHPTLRADCAFRWRDLSEHVAALNAADASDGANEPAADEAAPPADAEPASGVMQSASDCSLRRPGAAPTWRLLLLGLCGLLGLSSRCRALSGSSSGRTGS